MKRRRLMRPYYKGVAAHVNGHGYSGHTGRHAGRATLQGAEDARRKRVLTPREFSDREVLFRFEVRTSQERSA